MLLRSGDPCRTLVPENNTLGRSWTSLSFDDSEWLAGNIGVGYELGVGCENLIGIDVREEMFGQKGSVYTRVYFDLNDPTNFEKILLKMKYDDGFVAYLNGSLVATANSPEEARWNSLAIQNSEAVENELFYITNTVAQLESFGLSVLNLGTNILALHGLNVGLTSSDLLLAPELVAHIPGGSEEIILINSNLKVNARVLDGEIWQRSK